MPQSTNKKTINIVSSSILIGVASFFLLDKIIALVVCSSLIVLLFIFFKFQREKKEKQTLKAQEKQATREQYLTAKFGSDYAKTISNKDVKLGMTKEMVIEAIGNPESSKRIEKTNGIKEKCLWTLRYKTFNGIRGKKYGVFENEILIEYGDR